VKVFRLKQDSILSEAGKTAISTGIGRWINLWRSGDACIRCIICYVLKNNL